MHVQNYNAELQIDLPVSGAGSNISDGALLFPGTTPSTDNGHLKPATGFGEFVGPMGIINGTHLTANDTDVAGTTFTTKKINLVMPYRIVRMEFSQASADLITCTQAVNSTTMTVTSLENSIQASFIYVASGTGAGQMNYVASQAGAGAVTLKAAFTTNLDTTSKFVKILRRFHYFAGLTSDGTKLASQAAAASARFFIVDLFIRKSGAMTQLDPTKHSALTGLTNDTGFKIFADVAVVEAGPYVLV